MMMMLTFAFHILMIIWKYKQFVWCMLHLSFENFLTNRSFCFRKKKTFKTKNHYFRILVNDDDYIDLYHYLYNTGHIWLLFFLFIHFSLLSLPLFFFSFCFVCLLFDNNIMIMIIIHNNNYDDDLSFVLSCCCCCCCYFHSKQM